MATRADVARLFARAAFGSTAADLDKWTDKRYADAVEHLLAVPHALVPVPQPDEPRRMVLERGSKGSLVEAQRWWLERMRTTLYPLEERMTLFWHDHFATASRDPYPDAGMLLQQNQTLRTHALGNFRDLCIAMVLDPAMLYWLNGAENVARNPNENFAREFFELFTLGTIPQVHRERDVREAARALTGWTVDPAVRIPQFTSRRHDAGRKTVLGRVIPNLKDKEYIAVVDAALRLRNVPLFLAYKLVLSFAYIPKTTDLIRRPDPLVSAVAKTLKATRWDLRAAMRTLLLADAFRYASAAQGRQIVRQPIDLVVSACRAFAVSADSNVAVRMLRRMGQAPFEPPNVGGWPAGVDWLSPATSLARYDWGIECYQLWKQGFAPLRTALPGSSDLTGWLKHFGLAGITTNTKNALQSYLRSRAHAAEAERQAGVLVLLASSPEWMVV